MVRLPTRSISHGIAGLLASTSPDRCRFEQAFSPDGGATWEINWIAVDTRR